MKVLSRRYSVRPPKMTMIARLAQSIGSILFFRSASHPTCAKLAAIATAVATKMSQIWIATKNRATGKRSNRNFIQWRDSTSVRGGRSFPGFLEQYVLAVRTDKEAPPYLAFGARLDGPVAAAVLFQLAVQKQRVLHDRARLVNRARPSLDVRKVAHLAHRATQRHVALVGIGAVSGFGNHLACEQAQRGYQDFDNVR